MLSAQKVPLEPPSPEDVQQTSPLNAPADTKTIQPTLPSTQAASLPPSPPRSIEPTPLPPPTPKPRKRRFRRFLTSLVLLSTLGYAGGVYYSLESDGFHDFFTEYIPFGEDAVAWFEEREFRRRFPAREGTRKVYPQLRGENKITIAKASGVTPHVVENAAVKGPHVNAVEHNKISNAEAQQQPSQATGSEKTNAVQQAKKDAKTPKMPSSDKGKSVTNDKTSLGPTSSTSTPAIPSAGQSTPAAPVTLIDHLAVPDGGEPLVQKAVKVVNDIITVINSDTNNAKYQSTLSQAKTEVSEVVTGISDLKSSINAEAEKRIASAHQEFDIAARELVSRLDKEMQAQELRWQEEYASERERMSKSYSSKLATEVDAARNTERESARTALVEQELALQRRFAKSIQDRVESERNGRLARLDQLSGSISELEGLTSKYNDVVDSNLSTQHLHVALDAVRAALTKSGSPASFANELVALQEIGKANPVIDAAVSSIPPIAYQKGIPPIAVLIDRYRGVAQQVRKAALLPENAGVASHAASALLSRVLFSKKSEKMPVGDDVEAVLSRTEILLQQGNLDDAVREMNGLKGWAGLLSRDWVAECRRILETRQAIEVSCC